MTAVYLSNRLERQLARLPEVPAFARPWCLSVVLGRAVLGRVVPNTGTAKLRCEKIATSSVKIFVANDYKVLNHIGGGVHDMVSTLAAETATGMGIGMGMDVRDDCIPVVKDMFVHFKKCGRGAMRAMDTLKEAQRALIRSATKGKVTVPVPTLDESGNKPIKFEFIWAQIPPQRPSKTANAS